MKALLNARTAIATVALAVALPTAAHASLMTDRATAQLQQPLAPRSVALFTAVSDSDRGAYDAQDGRLGESDALAKLYREHKHGTHLKTDFASSDEQHRLGHAVSW